MKFSVIGIVVMFFFVLTSLHLIGQTSAKHPFLLVTQNDLQFIKLNIQKTPWKKASWQLLEANAKKYLEQKIEIPTRAGNWNHYYVSPVSGYELMRGKQTGDWQWEHFDQVTGQKVTSDPTKVQYDYDGVVIGFIHDAWAQGALELGLAWQISNDSAYAKKAREILLAYAALYPELPVRNKYEDRVNIVGKGKIHVQGLDESIWLIDMVQSTDLIWETLNEADRNLITNQLLVPSARLIINGLNQIHNIQCWKSAAVGMVGFLTGDQEMITYALTKDTTGFRDLVTKGVTKEGLWFERSASYHYYALTALTQLAQSARNAGYNINLDVLKRMYRGPIFMANPHYWIPAFNDSRAVNLHTEGYLYEWAYHHFKDSLYAIPINRDRRGKYNNLGPVFTGWSLLYGEDSLPKHLKYIPVHSRNLPDASIAMLSNGYGDNNLSLYLKYDRRTGTHVHYDELNFVLYKGSEQVAITPATESYASLLNTNWYQSTMAHNTFVVNGAQQKRSAGKCLFFNNKKGPHYVITETTNAYNNTKFVRTACLLSNNLVMIIDQFKTTESPVELDIMYHQAGKWELLPGKEPWADSVRNGYKVITNGAISSNLQSVHLSTRLHSGKQVMISAAGTDSMRVITGYGERFEGDHVPVTIFRRNTNETVMAWCIALDGQKIGLKVRPATDIKGNKVSISDAIQVEAIDEHQTKYTLLLNPELKELRGIGTEGSTSSSGNKPEPLQIVRYLANQ
ncbi:MAG TPA: alginate lyase family protein [Niastella sp.]